MISSKKNSLLTPQDVAEFAEGYIEEKLAEVYINYQNELISNPLNYELSKSNSIFYDTEIITSDNNVSNDINYNINYNIKNLALSYFNELRLTKG